MGWAPTGPRKILVAAALALALAIVVSPRGVVPTEGLLAFPYQGIDRHYLLHRSFGRTGKLPLVVAIHGWGQPIADMQRSWTMDAVADREGFNVLYPAAVAGRWAYVDMRPVVLPNGGNADDTGFILALVDKLIADHVADPAHIYLAGASNGGLVAWTFACQASDRIAAVAPMISGMLEPQMAQCHPKRLIPMIVIAGTDDWVQVYDGLPTPDYPLLSMPETLQFWRRLRGCAGLTHTVVPPYDPNDPTEAVLIEWTDCKDPSPQQYYRIEGGGHSTPSYAPLLPREKARHGGRSRTIETAEVVWAFFHHAAP
jgi:polyhydroxybutyrate depolymerase